MFPSYSPSQLMLVKSQFPFDVCSSGTPVSIQVFGAPPQQPRRPHGPGSEPDQHRHEERRLRGPAPLAAAQPQVQAPAEGQEPPDGLPQLAAQDVPRPQPQQARKVEYSTQVC